MKRIPLILFILIIFINFSSCEKDDICVDGDTPFLIVGFYDFADSTVFKSVTSLRIRSMDNDSIYTSDTFSDQATVNDSIFIPLRVDATDTTYEFILNSDGDANAMAETGTISTLGFSYSLGEEFVSRACGFVANYNELDTIRTVSTEDWIRRITIIENTITNNPTTIHVKIFH
jgi:hypothetical protein